MPALDFKEIPKAHVSDGKQDTFELLARDFFVSLGFEIDDGPDRGQDGGRDLLITERREGLLGTTNKRWLVSCKHKAHSHNSVAANDETDIADRMTVHGADGFIGFYSAVLSAPLSRKLDGLKDQFDVKIFDQEAIETALLSSADSRKFAKRYFPNSYMAWENSAEGPKANFLDQYEPLNCVVCGKDLLTREVISTSMGIVVWVEEVEPGPLQDLTRHYIDFYWVCKGACDDTRTDGKYGAAQYMTSWNDITDIAIPAQYVRWYIGVMNTIYNGTSVYNRWSYERMREFTIKVAQLTLRHQTEAQKERLADLAQLPPGI